MWVVQIELLKGVSTLSNQLIVERSTHWAISNLSFRTWPGFHYTIWYPLHPNPVSATLPNSLRRGIKITYLFFSTSFIILIILKQSLHNDYFQAVLNISLTKCLINIIISQRAGKQYGKKSRHFLNWFAAGNLLVYK